MVEQIEVGQAWEMSPILDLERDRATPVAPCPGGAGKAHEQVAEDPAERLREGGADEVVGGVREERDLLAAVAQVLVRIVTEPVRLGQRPVAEILDPDAAAVDDAAEGRRLGKP